PNAVPATAPKAAEPVAAAAPASASKKTKLSYKEQKELDALPERIAALEAGIAAAQGKLGDPAIYQDGGETARQLQAQLEADEAALLDALERWEVLEARSA